MAVYIKTIDEIYEDMLNSHASEFDINTSDIGDSIKVFYKVVAAEIYLGYLSISKTQNNLYPDLSEEEELIRDGEILLQRSPAPATQGVYTVEVTGVIGSTITENTRFQSNIDATSPEYLFIIDSDYTLVSNPDTVTLRSLTAGTEAQLSIGDRLTAIQPIFNVNGEVEVTGITTTPSSAESIESYRQDVLAYKRLIAQGGSHSDYRIWANEVAELRNIYIYTDATLGNISIYAEVTAENTALGEYIGTPSQTVLDAIYKNDSGIESGAIIISAEGRARKPIGVKNISISSVGHNQIDIYLVDLSDLGYTDTIKTSIEGVLYSKRPFIAGVDIIANRNDILTLTDISNAIQNVLLGTGVSFNSPEMKVDGISINSYQFIDGNIPRFRSLYINGVLS